MADALRLWGGAIRLADDPDRPIIEGVAIPYRPAIAETPKGPLSCEAGCVTYHDFVQGNLQHDRKLTLGRMGANLEFKDTPEALTFRMSLLTDTTNGRDALFLIRAGLITGASAEFYSLSDRLENGISVHSKILLTGLALCDQPAYPEARISEALAAAQAAPYRPRARIW